MDDIKKILQMALNFENAIPDVDQNDFLLWMEEHKDFDVLKGMFLSNNRKLRGLSKFWFDETNLRSNEFGKLLTELCQKDRCLTLPLIQFLIRSEEPISLGKISILDWAAGNSNQVIRANLIYLISKWDKPTLQLFEQFKTNNVKKMSMLEVTKDTDCNSMLNHSDIEYHNKLRLIDISKKIALGIPLSHIIKMHPKEDCLTFYFLNIYIS